MATVTGTEVWKGISQESNFLKLPESLRNAVRPYIEAMPEVLAPLLDAPATLDTIMQATAKFLHYCRDNGYITATVQATPEDMLKGYSTEQMELIITGMYQEAIILAEVLSTAENVAELVDSSGITEEEAIVNLGMSKEALARYQAGTLTIGEFLSIDPSFFFQTVAR